MATRPRLSQQTFLAVLRNSGNQEEAAKEAGLSIEEVQALRESDPEFAKSWEEVKENWELDQHSQLVTLRIPHEWLRRYRKLSESEFSGDDKRTLNLLLQIGYRVKTSEPAP